MRNEVPNTASAPLTKRSKAGKEYFKEQERKAEAERRARIPELRRDDGRGVPLDVLRQQYENLMSKENNYTSNESIPLNDAAMEALTNAGFAGVGRIVAEPVKRAIVRTVSKSLDWGVPTVGEATRPAQKWSVGHILTGDSFMEATKSGVLVQPSFTLSKAGHGFPLPSPYASAVKQGYPDVIIKIPESVVKGNPKAVWGNSDLGSPTMASMRQMIEEARERGSYGVTRNTAIDLPKELETGTLNEILRDPKKRAAFHKFRDDIVRAQYPSTASAMRPNVGDGMGATSVVVNGANINKNVPIVFEETIAKDWYPYGEIKILGDVPLSEIWKQGYGVILRTPQHGSMDKAAIKEIVDYLKSNKIPFKTEGRFSPFGDKMERIKNYEGIGDDFTYNTKGTRELEVLHADAMGGNSNPQVHADTEGGDNGETADQEMVPQPAQEVPAGGPRIAVNPAVFKDKRDALCVAMNEAYRIIMEMNGFEPQAEPTEKQRKFFSDTAYNEDETQLRRTILARICTFDTSVTDPTDEQLEEAIEFLETVMEIGAPQNEWEQSIVQRTHDILAATLQKRGSGSGGTESRRTGLPRETRLEQREARESYPRGEVGTRGNSSSRSMDLSETPKEPQTAEPPAEG